MDSLDDLNDEALLEKIHVAIRTSELKSVHRVASLDLKEDQLQDMLYAYVQQYQNMCLYQPDSVSKIGVTLIRGRQPTGAKILRDYSLSKVRCLWLLLVLTRTVLSILYALKICDKVKTYIMLQIIVTIKLKLL
ncbi:hypothetical protein DPMN_034344 [Dreissena polymorpha]|uniref:Uncharacterized protein n=1 Tax=Dreissena polymorpha TaxID=45954 RepID=A0A9D4M7G2_DREPO|nr:hypothetical protein DPMN_034344 [Dreissena polymorpha]